MPPQVKEAYAILDRETGLGHDGAAAAPGNDREPFDAESLYQDVRTDGVSFGGFSDGILAPSARPLVLEDEGSGPPIWRVGRAPALARVDARLGRPRREVPPDGPQLWLYCRVGRRGRAGRVAPPRAGQLDRAHSGALSLWSYCSDIPPVPGTTGYFRRLVAEKMTRGPIITTQSIYDRAVGTWYPWAAGAKSQVSFAPGELPKYGAVGAFGIQGPGADSESKIVLKADHSYGFEPGKLYNIECSGVINEGGGFSGAHSDIAKPEVAHAVWEAASV